MKINVCIAGATGWVGKALAPAVAGSSDLELVSAVSRSAKGQNLGTLLNLPEMKLKISGSVEDALQNSCNVLVDYTRPNVVKQHTLTAISNGVNVVIGTSGLSDSDYEEIDAAAREKNVGVLAAGNFAITAVLLMRFAEIAAKYVPHWEIIDYAGAGKKDAPSGTVRELAYRLSEVGTPKAGHSIAETIGPKETRGATVSGSQVHSLRLPGYVISAETIFGLPDERLTIRHDAGSSPDPYVAGTLLAIRKVNTFTGLKRGLDKIMDL